MRLFSQMSNASLHITVDGIGKRGVHVEVHILSDG